MPTILIPTCAAGPQDSTTSAQTRPDGHHTVFREAQLALRFLLGAFTPTTDVGYGFHVIAVGDRRAAQDVFEAAADPPPVASTGESWHRSAEADVLEVRARRM